MTQKQAMDVADRVAADLADRYGIVTAWNGKTAEVSGKGLRGEFRVCPKHFELELTLGIVLGLFEDRIAEGIEAEFDRLIGKTPAKRKSNAAGKR